MLADAIGFTRSQSVVTDRNHHHDNPTFRLARLAAAGPIAIDLRLSELDDEWDALRAVQLLLPLISIFGISLGLSVNLAWFVLPIVMQSFAIQQAIQGWSLPYAGLRRLGIRTEWEIDEERYALNCLLCQYVEAQERTRA